MNIDLTTATLLGADLIVGDEGNNNIVATADNAVVLGMAGDDTLQVVGANNIISGGAGDDAIQVLSGNAIIDAGSGDDHIAGGSGDDIINAGGGNDYVVASAGNDTYIGGSGFDTLDFSHANAGLDIDISKGIATETGVNTSFDGFEKIIGSNFADTIKGSSGDDIIDGGRGNDTIRSMAGADIITGGEGHDTYVYFKKDVMLNGVHQGVDTITDFSGSDTIDLHDFFKGQPGDINDAIHMTDTAAGTMISAKLGGAYVDVAMLQGQHISAETTVKALASDGLFHV